MSEPQPVPTSLPEEERAQFEGLTAQHRASDHGVPESWRPVNLAPVWDGLAEGTVSLPSPTVGAIAGGTGLFYPGRHNGIFGRFGSAKSYVGLVVAAQEIAKGRIVVWIDLEDNPVGMTQRLLELGADRTDVLAYFRYINPVDALGDATRFLSWVEAEGPSLVVADSTGEWLSLEGVKPNADEEVAAFAKRHLSPLAATGASLVSIDHIPHDARDPLRAIGSQRKMAGISGVTYLVEMVTEMGRGRVGMSRLISAKDRLGTYPRGSVVAELTLDATTMPYVARIAAPTGQPDWKPTVLMERVSEHLERHPEGLSFRMLRDSVTGKREYKEMAISMLIEEGHVSVTKEGQANIHRLVRPYTDPTASSAEATALLEAELGATEVDTLPDPFPGG